MLRVRFSHYIRLFVTFFFSLQLLPFMYCRELSNHLTSSILQEGNADVMEERRPYAGGDAAQSYAQVESQSDVSCTGQARNVLSIAR